MTHIDLRCLSVRQMVHLGLAWYNGDVCRAVIKGPPRSVVVGPRPYWQKRPGRGVVVLQRLDARRLLAAGLDGREQEEGDV